MRHVVFAIASSLSTLACAAGAPPSGTSSPTPPSPVTAVAPPAARPAGPTRLDHRIVERERPHDRADLGARYPQFSTNDPGLQAALEAINETLRDRAYSSLEAMAVDAIEDEIPSGMRYSLRVDCAPKLAEPGVVSVLCLFDSFMGGAHGHQSFEAFNWVIREGAELRVEGAQILSGAAATRSLGLRLGRQLEERGASLMAEREVPIVKLDALKAYTFEPDGIRFHFAPYAVGAYAEGSYDVLVPWDEYEGWLPRVKALEPLIALATKGPPKLFPCDERAGECQAGGCAEDREPASYADPKSCGADSTCCVPISG